VSKYQKRLSDPLLDRIDIHIEVPRVDYEKLSRDRMGEQPSSIIRQRVQAARDIQTAHFSTSYPQGNIESPNIACNANMRIAEIRKFCQLDEASASLMKSAITQTCTEPVEV
jgi:magnesium chelatase family protein